MLELTKLEKTDAGVKAIYTVKHNTSEYRTTLAQDLHVTICPRTGAVKGELHVLDLEAPSMDEARAKLALWCERLAEALREPLKAVASVPVYENDYDTLRAEDTAGPLGLTWTRLQALSSALKISREALRLALDELAEQDFITHPYSEVRYLRMSAKDDVAETLQAIERMFPGIANGFTLREANPLFSALFPYNHGAIVPYANTSRPTSDFFSLSETARVVYRLIADAYLDSVAELAVAKVDQPSAQKESS
jgi:DNA topoisomerase IA